MNAYNKSENLHLSNYIDIVYFKSSLFRSIGLIMSLWRKQPLTLLVVTIIQVCCGGTTILGDKLSVYREERLPGGRLTEQSCTPWKKINYWMLKHKEKCKFGLNTWLVMEKLKHWTSN